MEFLVGIAGIFVIIVGLTLLLVSSGGYPGYDNRHSQEHHDDQDFDQTL